ncbi:MAG: metallophosphoesterase family protein [Lentisphaerae bacterium]|nr:metallophosphoesterase family protein [Lentisphaerota bacterium]
MRLAVVSDLHANLQAWNAVLLDIRSLKVDRIVCLGDIVGYGPDPVKVLESVHANINHFVLGNHDAAVSGQMDDSLFNDDARNIIAWTRERVGENAASFLRTLPLSLDAKMFRCTHGEFSEPGAFNYIIDPADAMASWKTVDHPLLFVGHTHDPAIFLLGPSGTPHAVEPQDFEIETEKRYIVNVGSVGQPRDGDARACYCVHDTRARTVCWRRVPFDIDAYRDALNTAGVSAKPSYFLRHDPRAGTPPLRELLNFSPAQTPEEEARDTIEVESLEVLHKQVRTWKRVSVTVLLAAIIAGGAGGTLWWRHANRGAVIADPRLSPQNALHVPAGQNLVEEPRPADAARAYVPGWTVSLGDRRKQSVEIEVAENASAQVVMTSRSDDEMRLGSPAIRVQPGMKLQLAASFLKSPSFRGSVAVVVSVRKETDGKEEIVDRFVVKEPSVKRRGGWMEARKTFEIPANGKELTLQVRGRFTGSARLRDLSLERKN